MSFEFPYKKDFYARSDEFLEEGIYPARCNSVVFMGTHEKRTSKGQTSVFCPVSFCWEIGRTKAEKGDDGWPLLVYQVFHYNTDPYSRLMALLQAWNGRFFTKEDVDNKLHHPFKYVGKHCRIVVGTNFYYKGSQLVKRPFVQDVMVGEPTARNLQYRGRMFAFSAANPNRDTTLLNKLPKWIRNKVTSSKEWARVDANSAMEDIWDILDN